MAYKQSTTSARAGLSESFRAFHGLADLGFLRRSIAHMCADDRLCDLDPNDLGDAICDLQLMEQQVVSDPRVAALALRHMKPSGILEQIRDYVDENNVAERMRRSDDPDLEDDGFDIVFCLDYAQAVVREAFRIRHALDAGARKRLVQHLMTIREIRTVIRRNPLAFIGIIDEMQAYCEERGIASGVLYELGFPTTDTLSTYIWLTSQV